MPPRDDWVISKRILLENSVVPKTKMINRIPKIGPGPALAPNATGCRRNRFIRVVQTPDPKCQIFTGASQRHAQPGDRLQERVVESPNVHTGHHGVLLLGFQCAKCTALLHAPTLIKARMNYCIHQNSGQNMQFFLAQLALQGHRCKWCPLLVVRGFPDPKKRNFKMRSKIMFKAKYIYKKNAFSIFDHTTMSQKKVIKMNWTDGSTMP